MILFYLYFNPTVISALLADSFSNTTFLLGYLNHPNPQLITGHLVLMQALPFLP